MILKIPSYLFFRVWKALQRASAILVLLKISGSLGRYWPMHVGVAFHFLKELLFFRIIDSQKLLFPTGKWLLVISFVNVCHIVGVGLNFCCYYSLKCSMIHYGKAETVKIDKFRVYYIIFLAWKLMYVLIYICLTYWLTYLK